MASKHLPIADIPKYTTLLPTLPHPRVANFFTRVLQRFGAVLGYPLYWQLPEQYAEYADKPETQRALLIISRLLRKGLLTNSRIYQTNHPDEPPAFTSILQIKNQNNRGKYSVGWEGKSVHLFNKAETFWPALGEAIERYCCLYPDYKQREVIQNSYKNLGKPKVDIFAIAGLTDEQRAKPHATYKLQYDDESIFEWLPTLELTSNKTIYAPLQWFSFQHVREKLHRCATQNQEPMLTAPITTGAAAGQTKEGAILAGLFEVIERDAFIIYWLNQDFLQAKRIDLTKIENEEVQCLAQIAADYRLELHILYLETDVPVHTIGLVMIDQTEVGPAIMVTAKTGFDIEAMICAVLHDSLGQHCGARNFRNRNKFSEADLQPHKLMHATRMVYWHNPAQIPKINHFIGGKHITIRDLPDYCSTNNTRTDLKELLKWFATKKYQVLYRELINPKLKKLTEGISVAMVKVPKFQPVYLEESLRSTEGARLREVPVHLGYPALTDSPDPFHKEPHPFP